MHNSLVEILREDLGGAYVDMQEIAGGMDGLPNAFYAEVKDSVRFGANVFAIDQDPDGVTVHFKTESGRFSERADHIIVTIPFPVLRTVEIIKPFSAAKQRAIRQLNYHASTKILFQVRNRFWEEEDGIYGGGTVTELPIRRMNYPTPDPTTSRGVSCWPATRGARTRSSGARWTRRRGSRRRSTTSPGSTRGSARSTRSGRRMRGTRTGSRAARSRCSPRSSRPTCRPTSSASEGRIHFAGEHCSLYHAWIQGALESGIRAAKTIHEAPAG